MLASHADCDPMFPEGIEPEIVRDLFGGRGTVKVFNLDPSPMPPFTAALWCELEQGGEVGRHVQEEFPEIVIGLEGHGEASVDGAALPLRPGNVVQLPLGAVLSLRNLSAQAPLRYLILKAQDLP